MDRMKLHLESVERRLQTLKSEWTSAKQQNNRVKMHRIGKQLHNAQLAYDQITEQVKRA